MRRSVRWRTYKLGSMFGFLRLVRFRLALSRSRVSFDDLAILRCRVDEDSACRGCGEARRRVVVGGVGCIGRQRHGAGVRVGELVEGARGFSRGSRFFES